MKVQTIKIVKITKVNETIEVIKSKNKIYHNNKNTEKEADMCSKLEPCHLSWLVKGMSYRWIMEKLILVENV